MRRRKGSGGWCEWGGGDFFLWRASLFGCKSSADLLGSVCNMFLANAFPICGLTMLFGSAVSLLSVLLRCRSSAGAAGNVGGPTWTTRTKARLVFIWRCVVVELAAKSEGGPAGAVAPAMLRGSLLLAVVVAVVVVVVKATSFGRGLVMVRAVVLLLSPAHTSLYVCEYVCGCGVRGWSSCGG
ncbi:hypothetical protein VYU27_005712 [Nannochloropsis oceanica]